MNDSENQSLSLRWFGRESRAVGFGIFPCYTIRPQSKTVPVANRRPNTLSIQIQDGTKLYQIVGDSTIYL